MGLIGLRMMPTFPSSPLRFRTVGFPQYGSKAGSQSVPAQGRKDRSTTHRGLPPTFVSSSVPCAPVLSRGMTYDQRYRRASGLTALPQGPSLRSRLCCPGPSSLNRPHAPRSRTRHNFPAWRVICDALAVLAARQPRPSTSGSELSLTVPSQHVALNVPGESSARLLPSSVRRFRLRLPLPEARHSQLLHLNPLHVARHFGASWFAHRYNLLSCLPRADLTGCTAPSQPRLLLPSFRSSRSSSSPSGITTVVHGHFHRQDFHLLERQLSSLHERYDRPRLAGWLSQNTAGAPPPASTTPGSGGNENRA